MKNSNDTIGNRTCKLPACRAVPQPTAPLRAPPLYMFWQINFHPLGVFIKELQVLIASKYTIVDFTVDVIYILTL
jgi:hypothetical protein